MRTLLRSTASPSAALAPAADHAGEQQQQAISVDSDMVVILASLLCALICIAGLALVARCACRLRGRTTSPTPPPPKGLKKQAVKALPTVSFGGQPQQDHGSECAICLAEFAEGEELRVLPHCGHGFHVACIDTWLGGHASCPSCRATIVAVAYSSSSPPAAAPPESSSSSSRRCRRCGARCELGDVAAVVVDVSADGDERFLP